MDFRIRVNSIITREFKVIHFLTNLSCIHEIIRTRIRTSVTFFFFSKTTLYGFEEIIRYNNCNLPASWSFV